MKTRMRIGLCVLAGALTLGIAAGAPVAVATGGNCASKNEFKKVKKGMSMKRVAQIFDTGGKLAAQSGDFQIREYNACTKYGYVNVSYEGGRVTNKSAFF